MPKFRSASFRAIVRSGAFLPNRVLQTLELASRMSQGKGWGEATVRQEVMAALSLLPIGGRTGLVAIDVGANVGSWTQEFLRQVPTSNVFCFEPSATAYETLTSRFENEERVHPFNLALSDKSGPARLWSDYPGSGLASLSRRRLDHMDISFLNTEQVQLSTLDQWCSEESIQPRILKLDVEGHELHVLNGATGTLASVDVIQFEFGGGNIDSRTFFQDFFYFFQERRFKLFRLTPSGLREVSQYRENDEAFATTNYFAQRLESSRGCGRY